MVVVLINDDDDEAQRSISDFSYLSRRSLMKNKIIFWNHMQTSNNLQMKIGLTHIVSEILWIPFYQNLRKTGMSLHSTMFTVCKI